MHSAQPAETRECVIGADDAQSHRDQDPRAGSEILFRCQVGAEELLPDRSALDPDAVTRVVFQVCVGQRERDWPV